jgi:hypothetical protein
MKIMVRNNRQAEWKSLQSSAYGSEAELQSMLAETPSLISIDEIREGAGTLVAAIRELPLAIGYIDLIGFSAKGDIALVECKRAVNSEVKREVIGQVFEYGANIWRMEYETLDQKILLRTGKNLVDFVRGYVGPEWDEEEFRTNVKSSLDTGNFILIIVVDEIREELSRIVRFLNDAGKPAFSIAALEMQRFQHEKVEMLVPHIFGSTQKLPPPPKRKWDKRTFFEELSQRKPECADPAHKILDWAEHLSEPARITWGEGSRSGSFVPVVNINGKDQTLFAIYTYGVLETYFYYYKYRAPFDRTEKRIDFLERLNKIKDINLALDSIDRRPSIPLTVLNDPQSLQELFRAFEWFIQEIRSVN